MAKKNPGSLSERIAVLETHFGDDGIVTLVKEKLDKVDERTWYILSGVIISIILALAKLFI